MMADRAECAPASCVKGRPFGTFRKSFASRLFGAVLAATALTTAVDVVAFESNPASAATVTYNGAVGAERIGVIGDSVMAAIRWYGTWQPLRRFNYSVDVESCRRTIGFSCRGREGYTPDNTVNAMRRLRGQLGSVVVIGTGYDDSGATFSGAVDAVMAEAAAQGIPVVIWATMRTADVTYVGPTYSSNSATFRDNNRILLAKQAQYGGRLHVADWAGYSASRSDWVEWDGIHLTPSGATAMAEFIADQAAAQLQRVSRPSAPTVTATPVSSGQIRLSWTPPVFGGLTPIVDYGFQRSSDGGRTWRGGYAGTATARSVVISGLTNGQTYHFKVAARNGAGWGEVSSVVSVVPRVMPPSAPRLTATVVGAGRVQLSWSAPAATGGAPISYYGFQRSTDGGHTWRGGDAGPASARSVLIDGLVEGQEIQFKVAALNSAGWGEISNVVTLTPRPRAPSAPLLSARVVGPGEVELTWTTPAYHGGRSIIDYGFQRSSDGGRTWRGGYAGTATARSVVISGLTAGEQYRFRVAARNAVGWGTISNTVTVVPAVTRPSAPTLTATAIGPDQVELAWTTPSHDGGDAINDFGFQWSSDGGATWHGGYAGPAEARSVVIDGLTPGQQYQYKVAARNDVGWGVVSNIVSVTPGDAAALVPATSDQPESEPPESNPPESNPVESNPPESEPAELEPPSGSTPAESSDATSPSELDLPGAVGDRVWVDTNGDGLQNEDEPGVVGVVVRLIGADGTIADQVVTDAAGAYRLSPTITGEVTVEVVIPVGYQVTSADAGSDDALDSDARATEVRFIGDEAIVRIHVDFTDVAINDVDIGLVMVSDPPIETEPPHSETETSTTGVVTTSPTSTAAATTPPTATTSPAPVTSTEPSTTVAATTTAPLGTIP